MEIICKECGRAFTITNKEINFFQEKGYSMPKKCKDCRSGKTKTPVAAKPTSNNGYKGKGKGGKGKYKKPTLDDMLKKAGIL